MLVSKDVLLDIKLLRYKLPCCYRENLVIGEMKSVKNVHSKISNTL